MAIINGTSKSDRLNGTAGRDTFNGMAGNDTIDGQGGTDTARYAGKFSEFDIRESGSQYEVRDRQRNGAGGDEGTDRLTNVERLEFSDRLVLLNNGDVAPVGADVTRAATEGQKVKIYVSEFASDADGDALVLSNIKATNGSVTQGSDAQGAYVEYTPNANYSGKAEITYSVTESFSKRAVDIRGRDVAAKSDSGTITIDVAPRNELPAPQPPPIVVNDATSTVNGTSKSDRLNGTAGRDTFNGMAGNDTIDGQGGTDTARYAGKFSEFRIKESGSQYEIEDRQRNGAGGDEGTDRLTNVERLEFSDRLVLLNNGDIAPVGSDVTRAATEGQKVKIYVSEFASDADGDALVLSNIKATNGSVTQGSDAQGAYVEYTPNASYSGKAEITYSVTESFSKRAVDIRGRDVAAKSDSGTITIDVAPAKEAAHTVSVSAPATVAEGADYALTFTLSSAAASDQVIAYTVGGQTDSITIPQGQLEARVSLTAPQDQLHGQAPAAVAVAITGITGGATTATATASVTVQDDDAAPTVSVSAPATVAEGADYALTFALSSAAASDQVIAYTVGDQTDSITIPQGQLEASVSLTAPQDQLHGQAPAAVAVAITGITGGATTATATASVTVQDDDAAPTVSVSAPATVAEGADYALTFTLSSAAAADQVIAYTVGGQTDSITIPQGQLEARVSLTAPQDQLHGQAPAAVAVAITGITGGATTATATASVTVQDDDAAPTVSVSAPATVAEGAAYDLTFTLSSLAATDQVIAYTVGGQTDSITIEQGQLTARVSLTAPQDQLHGQAPAAVAVAITGITGGATTATATASVTVQDDDAAPTVSVSAPATVAEGAAYDLTFTLSSLAATDQVIAYTVGGQTDSITIEQGQLTARVSLTAPQDQLHGQAPAAVAVAITGITGGATTATATASVTVQDDDAAPSVVSIQNATASEAAGEISIPVTLSHPATQEVTLTYEVSAPSKVIGFGDVGAMHSAIPAGYEGLRWTGIDSSGDGGALTATTGGGQIQALDPNGLSVSSLTVSSASANQVVTIQAIKNGAVVGTETVTLGNSGLSSAPVTVTLGLEFSGIDALHIDGSADSFGNDAPVRIDNVVVGGGQPTTGTLTIPAGQSSGSITIPVVNDSVYEVGEAVTVRLIDAQGAKLGSEIEATGSITNDDAAPLPMVSITNVFTDDVQEGLFQEFEVNRDSRIDESLTVEFESALFGNQSVTFAPGDKKVWATFGKADDKIAEPNQPYEITLAPSANYVLGAVTSVSGMYIDNDGGTLNTAPTASSAVTYIQEGDFTTYGGTYSLAAYGSDAENDKLTFALVGAQPANGTINFDPDLGGGALMFTPNAGFLGTLHQGQTYEFTYQFTVSDGEFTTAQTTGKAIIYGSGSPAPVEEPTSSNQTITASITATSFAGGGGNDTLVFPEIPAGSTQLLGGTVANSVISLGGAIVGTPYAGKTISNIENLTFQNIAGPAGRTLTINGDAKDNTITVARTVRETNINGGDGNDTISFTGANVATSEHNRSVISGGTGNDSITVTSAVTIDDRVSSGLSGNDTYVLGSGKQELRFGAGSGNDIIRNFTLGDDVLNLAAAGVDASTVAVTEVSGNTVFTVNGTSTLTVQGVTGMQFGTHWTAAGTYTPPGGGEPTGEPGIIIEQTGGSTQVEEGGATDTITIALASAPTADVTVVVSGDYFQVGSNPDDPYGELHLTFTPGNWNVPQTVTVTAIDDFDAEEAGLGRLYVSTLDSADPRYDYFYPQNGSVAVSVTDNDTGGAGNTAPSALDVVKDTYDTDLSLDVEGFGYDSENASNLTYEIVSQPAEGTVTALSDGKFHFEGNPEFLDALKRGEIKPVTFQYQVSDGELTSEPAKITINVHGTDPGDETIQAFTRTTPSQTDFFPLDGKDGNDTVVFHSVTLTSGTGLEISLGKTIKWTEYDLKPIVNIENITIKNTDGNTARTMTVGGDDQANVITIENTNHKLTILGRGGDDTINFKGTGNGLTSVINGGAGNDTVNAQSAAIVNVADGNDTVNVFNGSNVTVQNFTAGDKLNFASGIQASNVTSAVQGANTVFTINQDGVTSTVTVVGVTSLVAGTDWTAEGAVVPPPAGPAVINAVSASAEVTEGGIATFTFSRTGDLSQPLTAAVDTSIGTAVPGQDFNAPTTIIFAAGSDTATLEVQTIDDGLAEGAATIEVRIVPGAGYTVGAADGNVTDLVDAQGTEPDPVRPSLSINDVTVDENAEAATFTVTLSAAAAAAVSVDYATDLASGPAGTFTPTSGTLTFEPGETTKTIDVPINDNGTIATGAQKFVVNLSNVVGEATLADLLGEGAIVDDDLPTEMPALTIATTTGLDEFSTISWNAIPGAASYVLIGIEPDEPNFPPHTLGFAVAPATSLAINGNDEFTGMVVTVEARDANGNLIARSENQTDLIANVNDVPTGRPIISDNTPEVGQLLTISIGDLEDGDGMRADRPDEYGYIWERSSDGVNWSLVSTTDSYQVTAADAGYLFRGAARYEDRGDTLETVYSLATAKVGDPNPNTPPVAFDDAASTPMGKAIAIDVLQNDFDFEGDATSVEAYGQGKNGTVTAQDGTLVYTPNASFVGLDSFDYTLNGGDTAKVTVTVTQEAQPLTLLTVDGLDENSILSWTAVPGAVSYVLIGLEPDDLTAPPHELGFALAPNTTFDINGDDEFAGMAIHIEARDANGSVITRSVNETGVIENINDVPTGNLSVSDMTPEVGQALTLGYGTFEDGDGYRDRGRPDEFEWSWQRSQDGGTWTTITTGQTYTVTQADNGAFLRGRAIYEDRAGDTIETVYSLRTSRVGATQPGDGGGEGGGGGGEIDFGGVIITKPGNAVTATELGANGTFTLVLADAPTANVTVNVSGDNQVYAMGPAGSSSEVIFTPENWNQPQTVTVIASEDGVEEGPHTGNLYFDTSSTDPRYAGLMLDEILEVVITDSAPEPEPMPYVTVANLGGNAEEGGEITFTFHRSEGTKDLPILWERTGTIDADDIAAIKWNGAEEGVEGFKGFAQLATMTIVLNNDAKVEGPEDITVRVLQSPLYIYDDPFEATATVLDVAPANTKPVVESRTVDLTEDQMTAEIKPLVTDADGNATILKVVDTLPTYVTFDEANQSFNFNGEASAFDHLNEGEKETITFRYVAHDGTEDSDAGLITININGITDLTGPGPDVEPTPGADPYNYDLGNGGPAGQRTAGNDILNDGAGLSSTIQGYGGNDTVYGRDGNDNLVGGNGHDAIYGGLGDDSIIGDGGGAATINGGAPGDDLLYGGDGSDTILGADGNDTLVGGHGADVLTGGLGDDTFVYLSIFDRGDTVTMQGQVAANDVFDFRQFDFDPNEPGRQGPTDGFQLFNQTPVTGQMVEDAFYYDASNGRLSINTGQDGVEDFSITVLAGQNIMPRLNNDDFLI